MALRDLMPFGSDRRGVTARGDNPFEVFQREMNRLFDDFFRGFGGGAPTALARYGEGAFGAAVPRVDVSETASETGSRPSCRASRRRTSRSCSTRTCSPSRARSGPSGRSGRRTTT